LAHPRVRHRFRGRLRADSAAVFLDLVQELRETESSKFTVRDTPLYTCHRSAIEEILDSLA
jgi:chlorite dismutase